MDLMEDVIEDMLENWMFDGISDDSSESSSLSDSSTSDDDDEPPHQKMCIRNYIEDTVHQYSDVEFQSHFGLKRQTAYNLIERYEKTNFLVNDELHQHVTHEQAFLFTLWYLANNETSKQIAQRFALNRSSAERILLKTLIFINSLRDEFIKWPYDVEEKRKISEEFSRDSKIQRIIGAIDTCHIQIKRPVEDPENYVNRKYYHSIVIQAVVTSKKIFADVYVGEPGSLSDRSVLRRSPLYHIAHEDQNFFDGYFLVGGSAYPKQQWLLQTFRHDGQLKQQKKQCNYRHVLIRMSAKEAFLQLRSRFRRLLNIENLPLDVIINCVMAACILHNVCNMDEEKSKSDENNEDDKEHRGENDDVADNLDQNKDTNANRNEKVHA